MCSCGCQPDRHATSEEIFIFAQWMATFREYYVEVGRELERDKKN